jgi:hypothetical protein
MLSARRESVTFAKRNPFGILALLIRNALHNRSEYRGVGKWRTFTVWSYATTRFATQHNVGFLDNPDFQRSYDRAVAAAGDDWWNVGLHFRLHQAIWCAQHCMTIPGDFVELGTGRGMTMAGVLEALPNWATSGKTLYLCDTFEPFGIESSSGQQSAEVGINPIYAHSIDAVRATFADRTHVTFVQGLLPDSLTDMQASSIAFLHIDLNSAAPEVASLHALWPRLSTGALVLLDDYAYVGSEDQYAAMNEFARTHGVMILTMPSGQGLLIKP